MKAGDRDRAGALRLVLSELQKDAKEGAGDELAVLRRERKRRRESEEAYRGRAARSSPRRRGLRGAADRGLPAGGAVGRRPRRARGAGDRRDRRPGPARHGQGDQARHGAAGGRADGRRVSTQGEGSTQLMARRQLELSNEVAAELAGSQDAILQALEEHLTAQIFLRGNVVTLDGDAEAVQAARDGRARAVRAGRARARHRAGDDRVGRARARRARVARAGARGRRLAPPQPQGRAEVGQPEALRRRDPPQHDHVRRRPGRHRQDVPGDGDGRRRARRAARSTASSSRAPRSRPASAWASCPAT